MRKKDVILSDHVGCKSLDDIKDRIFPMEIYDWLIINYGSITFLWDRNLRTITKLAPIYLE